jgi:hypothetical protein
MTAGVEPCLQSAYLRHPSVGCANPQDAPILNVIIGFCGIAAYRRPGDDFAELAVMRRKCRRPIKMSPLCQLQMTLSGGISRVAA